jgi:hypothetical protein
MLWNAEDPLFLGQIGLFTVEGVVAWLDGGSQGLARQETEGNRRLWAPVNSLVLHQQ